MRCTEVSGGRIAREGVFPVCTPCGSALPDRPLVREGKVYCRERCILDGLPVGHRPGFQDERYAGLAEAGAIVRSREERFDGSGYPDGQAGRRFDPLAVEAFLAE